MRRRRLRAGLLGAGGVAVALATLAFGNAWLRPGVSRSRIRIATVTEGPMEASISASGTVVPEVERVISSPVDARLVRILRRAGDNLSAGDPIVELDTREAELVVARLDQNMAVKANQQARTRLGLRRSLADLTSRREIKVLELESLRLQLARSRQLFAEGLVSQEVLRQAEVAEARAAIELKQIDAERLAAEEATRTELEGLDLEMRTLGRERDEAARQLDLARTRADAPGVLTWVPAEEIPLLYRRMSGGARRTLALEALDRVGLSSRVRHFPSQLSGGQQQRAASRTLVGQFLVENVVLTALGGAIGFLLAALALAAISSTGWIPYAELRMNYRIFAWGLGLTLFFGVLSGVYPAWRMSRLHPVDALKGGAR